MRAKKGRLLLMTVAIAAIVTLSGCKKKEQPAPTLEEMAKTATKAAEEVKKGTTAAVEEAKKIAPAAIEQTVCPVMGNPINKQCFTEYKGQKVYFCCPECIEKFNAEPEKYIAKLPQFKQ